MNDAGAAAGGYLLSGATGGMIRTSTRHAVAQAPVSDAVAHANATLNAFFSLTGGIEALCAGGILFTLALALSPDMRAFPCLPPWIRYIAIAGALGNAWRGVTLVTSASSPLALDVDHLHPDIAISWAMHLLLMASVLVYVLGQKLNPEVRARMMRRWTREQVVAHAAQAAGRDPLSALTEFDGRQAVLGMGGSPSLARRLAEMP